MADIKNITIDGTTYDLKDAKAREDVSDLKEDISDTDNRLSPIMSRVLSHNRFNRFGDITEGYYLGSNGDLIENSNWNTSDYCYVGDLSTVNCLNKNTAGSYLISDVAWFACSYDSDKRFIERISSQPSNPISVDGASYIRFCFHPTEDISKKMLTDFTVNNYSVGYYDYKKFSNDTRKSFSDAFEFNPVTFSNTDKKYIAQTGLVLDVDDSNYKVSEEIPVYPNEKVMLTTKENFGQMLYAIFDNNDDVLVGQKSKGTSAGTYLYNEIITIPENAEYILIGSHATTPYLFRGVEQNSFASGLWSNKKWTCVGDSLTEHNARTSMHYYDYVKGATGINPHVMGVSGTGYARGSDSGNAFYQRAENVPSDSDVITIFGSFNDIGAGLPVGTYLDSDTTTLAGCINATIDAIIDAVPLANVGIVSPTPWVGVEPSDTGTAYEYVAVMERICKHRSIPFLDLWRCSNLRPWDADFRAIAYTKDDGNGVHPDETGHKIIAPRFKAFLESLLLP